MDSPDLPTSPRKKLKLQNGTAHVTRGETARNPPAQLEVMSESRMGPNGNAALGTPDAAAGAKPLTTQHSTQLAKEAGVGIQMFVSPDLPGFEGILKQRYSDFLVYEILPSGQVIHLDNLSVPRASRRLSPPANNEKGRSLEHKLEAGKPAQEQHLPPAQVDTQEAAPDIEKQNAGEVKTADSIIVGPKTSPEAMALGSAEVPQEPIEQEAKTSTLRPHERPSQLVQEDLETSSPHNKLESPRQRKIVKEMYSPTTKEPTKTAVEGVDRPSKPCMTSPGSNGGNREAFGAEETPTGVAGWQTFAKQQTGDRKLSTTDESELRSYFEPETVAEILSLYNRFLTSAIRKAASFGVVRSAKMADRDLRTRIHQAIRRIFCGKLDSYTDNEGIMVISVAQPERPHYESVQGARGGRGRGGNDGHGRSNHGQQMSVREKFASLGGDYLHFSLYKENKDTMEVVAFIARKLEMKPGHFQFAGTKDRRGITVQRVSAYRVTAERLAALNKSLRNAKVGNFEYHPRGLELGELMGNEFLITLRDCKFFELSQADPDGALEVEAKVSLATKTVGKTMEHLVKKGFINYYGLQRFGTFGTGTDTVGMKILQGDYKGAVHAILDFNPDVLESEESPCKLDKVSADDKARAWAINSFRSTGDSQPALSTLPRKFTGETYIIRHLGAKGNSNDYLGALQIIPRNLRLMYVHAYQSFVWNKAASYRWSIHGSTVVKGDLVLVNEHEDKTQNAVAHEGVLDQDGETIIQASASDRATAEADRFERARQLTAEEASSGRYSIFDVVLPTPDYDILYPEHLAQYYESVMAEHGNLDPYNMRRNVKETSLSGSYRKLLARPGGTYEYRVVPYSNETEQFVQTDLERLEEADATKKSKGPSTSKAVTGKSGARENLRPSKVPVHDPADHKAQPSTDELVDTSIPEDKPAVADGSGFGDSNGMQSKPASPEATKAQPDKLAIVLRLQLGSSQYATMALRELTKLGGVVAYKPDFGSGR